MQKLIDHISLLLDEPIKSYQSIAGGDISQAFVIKTPHRRYFLKCNSGSDAIKMFEAEARGLAALLETNTIAVPRVLHIGIFDQIAFLIMDYVEARSPNDEDLERFGYELARLHQVSSERFGFDSDNFIGSLPQRNEYHTNWVDFYINERLVPKFKMAISRQLMNDDEIPTKAQMTDTLDSLFIDVRPSLLHGDLWSGNYLIHSDGTPYLIDPAVYFGHHEIDIAMSKLFGGFGETFYASYNTLFPEEPESSKRIEIYQLYYLLVHLNLFGRSYYGAVKRIMIKYFQQDKRKDSKK